MKKAMWMNCTFLAFCELLQCLIALRTDSMLHPASICRRCFSVYAQVFQKGLKGLMPPVGRLGHFLA